MSSDTIDKILDRLDLIEDRLRQIENRKVVEPFKKKEVLEADIKKSDYTITEKNEVYIEVDEPSKNSNSYFLGFVGATCILFASVLLIKLSIDSGWLTPIRQCLIASLFSIGFISYPFVFKNKDSSYISLLPAIGIVTLHLTTYGAVFYHRLLDPLLGLLIVSVIGLLSFWLVNRLKQDTYGILSIVGTYAGALCFSNAFSQLELMALFLIIWDIAFTYISIKLKNRNYIIISAYLSLGLVSVFGLAKGDVSTDLNINIFIVQILQFLIFSVGTVLFSYKNKMKLTKEESWYFFPLIIFFYGQEYFFLQRVSDNWATVFSLAFAGFLLSIYGLAKTKMDNVKLVSTGMIYTSCSLIFAHSIFIVEFNDLHRLIFTLALLCFCAVKRSELVNNSDYKGPGIIAGLVVLYSYLSVLFGISQVSLYFLLFFGFTFGVISLYSSKFIDKPKTNIFLYLGHIQVFVSIYRLNEVIGIFAISPLWILYALGVLCWALKKNNIDIGNSSIPLIIIGLLRFLSFDISRLNGTEQILSLLIMGILIFVSGYLYRKIDKKKGALEAPLISN